MWVIPLVIDGKRVNAARNWVIGQLLVISSPMRIDRPIRLKIAADPMEQRIARRAFGHFHGKVNANQAHALVHELGQMLHAMGMLHIVNHRVLWSAVGIDDDRIGVIQHRRIGRPAAAINIGPDQAAFVEGFCQQHAAGPVLVLAIAVARLAGNEGDLLSAVGVARVLVLEHARLPKSGGRAAQRRFLGRHVGLLQPNISELHFHRHPGVQLQSQDTRGPTLLSIVVGRLCHDDAVDFLRELKAPGDDVILVPVVLLDVRLQLGRVADAADRLGFVIRRRLPSCRRAWPACRGTFRRRSSRRVPASASKSAW